MFYEQKNIMAQDMPEGNIGQGKKRCSGNSHSDVNVRDSQFSGDKATSNKKYSSKKRANKNASVHEIKFNVKPSKQDLTQFFNIK